MGAIASVREANGFFFGDDNFLIDAEAPLEIHQAMKEADLVQKISFMARADSVLEAASYLEAAKERIDYVDIGAESFLDAQLKRMKKGVTAEQNMAAIETLRRNGIKPRVYLILGDRETDYDELMQVSEVFMEHPEYLLLVASAGIRNYFCKGQNNYPDYVRVYASPFELLPHINSWKFSQKSHDAFMDGANVPERNKRFIRFAFNHIHEAVRKVRDGELTFEQGKKEAGSWTGNLGLSLNNLYQ